MVRLSLSAYGRATVGATYGTSKLLHLLEHVGPLPPAAAAKFNSAHKRLVDLNALPRVAGAPVRPGDKLPRMYSCLLVGRPAEGGFGALPVEEHVQAR